jgi:hypothetical protein
MKTLLNRTPRGTGRALLGTLAFAALATGGLAGCATSMLSVHSDVMMGLATKTRAQPRIVNPSCGDEKLKALPACKEIASWERLTHQLDRINYNLTQAALLIYPDLKDRFPGIEKNGFDILIVDDETPGLNSSGMGRIAINAGMRHLNATDDWLAFALAMEMGRIAARQHERNAALAIGVGVFATVTAGAGLLTTATGFLSSEVMRAGAASAQDREALVHARAILEVAGIKDRQLLVNLHVGVNRAALGTSSWAQRYAAVETVLFREAEAANMAAVMRAQHLADGPVAE